MGAGASSGPGGEETDGFHHQQLLPVGRMNKGIEAEANRIRGSESASMSSHGSSHRQLNRSLKMREHNLLKSSGASVDAGDEDDTLDDDDDFDRKSGNTTHTRLSAEGGIHAALQNIAMNKETLNGSIISLPRGGVYVRTQAGAVQFGVPPDTIKDSILLGLDVPSIFVVPHERFNLELGINVAEIEFPAYFNFFILQKNTQLVVTEDQETDLRVAFKETLEGPEDHLLYEDTEFGKFAPQSIIDARPNLRKEIDYFKEPRNGRQINCDTLINFHQFTMDESSSEEGSSDGDDHRCTVVDLSCLFTAKGAAPKPVASSKQSGAEAGGEEEEEEEEKEEKDGGGGDPAADAPYSLIIEDLRSSSRYIIKECGVEIASVPYSKASYIPTPETLEKRFKDVVILERQLDDLDEELAMEALDCPAKAEGDTTDTTLGKPANADINGPKYPGGQRATSTQGLVPISALKKADENSHEEPKRDHGRATILQHQNSSFKSNGSDTSGSNARTGDLKLDDELYWLVNTGVFQPPTFGVTMLGNSHGFDASGTTTGFIIWIHGYGIAVDPPPHCDAYLMMNGVSPRLVTSVILTHCHADHDAGTFQKVLKERRTTLLCTRTIYEHFIRKYSAVSGLQADFLNRLLDFSEVKIGEPTSVHGAVFEFFYSLHALPCIGFKVTCGGKTLSYSGDTFNDKDGLDTLEKRGILSPKRKEALLNFPWDCDLVLHECGVPPIHTPASTLQNLPDHIKENLYAVHIADKAANDAGLRKARAGFDNTITIHNSPTANNKAIQTLKLCAQTDIFRDSDIQQCIQLLSMSDRHSYRSGYEFEGVLGGVFFIIAQGVLKVQRKGKSPIILRHGDYFGEISALNGSLEHMTLTAVTDVEIIDINKFAFNQFLKGCPEALQRLETLEAMRSQGFSAVLRRNSVFANLTFPQKTQLQSLTRKMDITKGTVLVHEGKASSSVYLISKGEFAVKSPKSKTPPNVSTPQSKRLSVVLGIDQTLHLIKSRVLGPGALYIPSNIFQTAVLGEENSAALSEKNGSLTATEDAQVFEIEKGKFKEYLQMNPGMQLSLMKFSQGCVQ